MQQNNNKIYFPVSISKTVCFLIGDLQIKYHTHKVEKNYGCKKRRNRNLSINTGTGNVSFELTAKSFSMSIQFSKDLEIKDGVSIEAGVEYKLTYKMPDIKDEITQALSEIMDTIRDFFEEHKTIAHVVIIVAIVFVVIVVAHCFISSSVGIAFIEAIKLGLTNLLPIWIAQYSTM